MIFRALSCLFRLSCHFLIRLKKTHTQVYVAQPVDGRCLQSTTSGYLLGIQTCPNPSSGTRRQSRIILESFTKLVLCSLYNFLCWFCLIHVVYFTIASSVFVFVHQFLNLCFIGFKIFQFQCWIYLAIKWKVEGCASKKRTHVNGWFLYLCHDLQFTISLGFLNGVDVSWVIARLRKRFGR